MLAGLHDRGRQGRAVPQQAWPETDSPRTLALACQNPETRMVSLIVDDTTRADEREARARAVQQFGQSLPKGS
jgi:hypothetical protein